MAKLCNFLLYDSYHFQIFSFRSRKKMQNDYKLNIPTASQVTRNAKWGLIRPYFFENFPSPDHQTDIDV